METREREGKGQGGERKTHSEMWRDGETDTEMARKKSRETKDFETEGWKDNERTQAQRDTETRVRD